MPRLTLIQLITEDLGYCCPYFFFCRYKQTQVIADRLGMSPSTVRAAKAKVRDKKLVCENSSRCLRRA